MAAFKPMYLTNCITCPECSIVKTHTRGNGDTGTKDTKTQNDKLKKTNNIFIARRSYASAVLRVVILSACPSARPSVRLSVWTRVLCNKTKQRTATILIPTKEGNHSTFLTPTVVGERRPLPSEICAQSDPPRLRTAPTSTDFRLYSLNRKK